MSLRQLPALDHLQHVLGELEQPHAVRDRRLRFAHTLGELAERQAELVQHDRERTRLFDRRQILPRDVFDEAEQKGIAIVGLADDSRHRLHLRLSGGAPAALAGDQLVAAGRARSHEHRLYDTLRAHRVCEPRPGVGVETLPRLARVWMDRVDRHLGELRRSCPAQQNLQAATQTSPFSCVRQAPSPPSSKRPHHASGGRTRLPGDRGSALRRAAPSAARSS